MEGDDLLGQQQDEIAGMRYLLSQLGADGPEFNGCRTPFDYFQRSMELGRVEPLRDALTQTLKTLNPNYEPEPRVSNLLCAIESGDKPSFERQYKLAILAALA
jgi:hypothetical protein